MQKVVRYLVVALIIGVLLVAGIFIGMEYQKTMTPPPVKEMNVELISYSGLDIVNKETFTLKIEKDWLGMYTNTEYVRINNITSYGIIVHYV